MCLRKDRSEQVRHQRLEPFDSRLFEAGYGKVGYQNPCGCLASAPSAKIYLTCSSSTSNFSVAFGGILPLPAPRSP